MNAIIFCVKNRLSSCSQLRNFVRQNMVDEADKTKQKIELSEIPETLPKSHQTRPIHRTNEIAVIV